MIIGIDGKNVKQVFKYLKDAKQRLAIIAQSPDFPDKMGEQVLGVPVVQSSKGKDQLVEVIRVLNEWTIFPKLFGLRFDTTSDNTGRHIGSVTLIEKAKGHSLMWVACRHHSIEVHVKKVAKHCLGETTSPHYHLFKQLHDNWLEVVVDSDHSGIDYSSLELYQWGESEVLDKRANEVMNWALEMLDKKTWKRGDYKQVVELVLVWLCGVDMVHPGWKFHHPAAYHHAKFVSQINYIMKYSMLDDQVTWTSDEDRMKIKRMVPYIALYHAPSFLKSPIAIRAPYNDLMSYQQVRMFREVDSEVAELVLKSFSGQCWYLDESWITVSLLDDRLSNEERMLLAKTLDKIPRPEVISPIPITRMLHTNKVNSEEFWTGSQDLPSLSLLMGSRSWLIPNLLKLSSEDMVWLKEPVESWMNYTSYNRMKLFSPSWRL